MKEGRWNSKEQKLFIEAFGLYGKDWKKVRNHVGTRTTTQIRSHAQKYFIRLRKTSSKATEQRNEVIPVRKRKGITVAGSFLKSPAEAFNSYTEESEKKMINGSLGIEGVNETYNSGSYEDFVNTEQSTISGQISGGISLSSPHHVSPYSLIEDEKDEKCQGIDWDNEFFAPDITQFDLRIDDHFFNPSYKADESFKIDFPETFSE